jgi:hypothetical protein
VDVVFYLTTHNTNMDAPGGFLYWGLSEKAERGSGGRQSHSLYGSPRKGTWRIGRKGSRDGHLFP